jgi:hypothetical protein
LEWSIPSPPPVYNFADIPRVTSRYPMWDVTDPHLTSEVPHSREGDVRVQASVADIPAGGFRAPMDKRPDRAPGAPAGESSRVPSAQELGIMIPYHTTKPFFAALGIVVMFCGLILTRATSAGYAMLGIGALTLVVSLIWWLTSPLEPEHAHDAHPAHAHAAH